MSTQAERIERVMQGVTAGKITIAEADAYLRATCNTTYAQASAQTTPQAAPSRQASQPQAMNQAPQGVSRQKLLLAVLLTTSTLLIVALLYLLQGTPTGLVVMDVPQQHITNTTINISQEITALSIAGTLYGEGNATVYLDTQNGTLLVGRISSDPGVPRTNKAGYAQGEIISVDHAPQNATYYFDDGATTAPISVPFTAFANGSILIVANDANLTTYRLPVIIGDVNRTTSFEGLCVETCQFTRTNATLRIEATGEAALELSRIDMNTVAPNSVPQLAIAIPPLTIIKSTSIDLDNYFIDEDGDALEYTTGSSELAQATINGSVLTLIPVQNGSGTLTIYASDLHELVPVTVELSVVIENSSLNATPDALPNTTNGTTNTTAHQANITINATNETLANISTETVNPSPNVTNSTQNGTEALDCSNPNPNLRPTECLLLNATQFFPEQDIYWENLDRQPVGKFTIIGNLLITGTVVEHATGEPGARDFRIGYPDQDGNTVATIWVDSKTGDLHLRGRLIEENVNIAPPAGSYSVLTKRSIYLAYADTISGDLHIRGNIIPYRRSLD